MCWRRLWNRMRAPLASSHDVTCVQPPELMGYKLSKVNPKLMGCMGGMHPISVHVVGHQPSRGDPGLQIHLVHSNSFHTGQGWVRFEYSREYYFTCIFEILMLIPTIWRLSICEVIKRLSLLFQITVFRFSSLVVISAKLWQAVPKQFSKWILIMLWLWKRY